MAYIIFPFTKPTLPLTNFSACFKFLVNNIFESTHTKKVHWVGGWSIFQWFLTVCTIYFCYFSYIAIIFFTCSMFESHYNSLNPCYYILKKRDTPSSSNPVLWNSCIPILNILDLLIKVLLTSSIIHLPLLIQKYF